jgi:hypothetical protein
MAESLDLTRPIVGCCAGFEPDQTRIKLAKKQQNFFAAERSPYNDAAFCINTMNLESVLGQIKTDCSYLHDGTPCLRGDSRPVLSLAQWLSGGVHIITP